MRHRSLGFLLAVIASGGVGCEGDVNRPQDKGGIDVQVKDTPDLDPRTDHDVDVKTGDVDVDVHRKPGQLPDIDVDVTKPPDADKRANEDEAPGEDK